MPKIYVAVPCHNRKAIAEQCLPTIAPGLTHEDMLMLYNDGSTEYGSDFLLGLGFRCAVCQTGNIGIEAQRRRHFEHFANTACTHLYLTDADALHDPSWRFEALRLHEKYAGAPICLYNTPAHANMEGNTIDVGQEVIWRRVAPGISYFLSREQAMQVVQALQTIHAVHWNWDWTVPQILNYRMAISKVSLVDHIGLGGYHHPPHEGLDGGDRALNPTPWLVEKRAEVVKALSK